jgi:hypothetical protein
VIEMEEMKVKMAFALWHGVLDRLQFDDHIIDQKLREIFEEEFRYVISILFDINDAQKYENEVKEIIRKAW